MQQTSTTRMMVLCVMASVQAIALSPRLAIGQENVVIVLDDSGSMNDRMNNGNSRIEAAKKAIASLLRNFDAKTKLGILLLNGASNREHWVVPLSPLSNEQTTKQVVGLSANGGTPLGERMREGADALLQLREKQIYGTYRLLVVTDGEANDGRMLNAYLPDILSRGLVVDAIGVDMKTDHSLATLVHSYRRADDDAALAKALEEVFAEKVDNKGAGGKDDYAMLEAINTDMAKEALALLSRPNNSPIEAKSKPIHWGNVQSGGDSIFEAILGGLLACFIPLILFFAIVGFAISKLKKASKKNRW